MTLIRIIFAIFISPVAVFLTVGPTVHFWINIVLYLFGWLPGVIHAFYVMGTADGN